MSKTACQICMQCFYRSITTMSRHVKWYAFAHSVERLKALSILLDVHISAKIGRYGLYIPAAVARICQQNSYRTY